MSPGTSGASASSVSSGLRHSVSTRSTRPRFRASTPGCSSFSRGSSSPRPARALPALPAFDLGLFELQPVLFFAQRGERLARLIERTLGLAEVRVRQADIRLGVLGGALELDERHASLLQRVFPLRALRRERRGFALDAGDLLRPGRCLLARGTGLGIRARGAVGRRREARFDLRRFDLPAYALLARGLLLRLEVRET